MYYWLILLLYVQYLITALMKYIQNFKIQFFFKHSQPKIKKFLLERQCMLIMLNTELVLRKPEKNQRRSRMFRSCLIFFS
jgi:hypothetical protein